MSIKTDESSWSPDCKEKHVIYGYVCSTRTLCIFFDESLQMLYTFQSVVMNNMVSVYKHGSLQLIDR